MNKTIGVHTLLGSAVALTICIIGGALPRAQAPVAIDSARITISGTSNIHAYTASTTAIRITKAQFAAPTEGVDMWTNALNPGGVTEFEVAIPAATLTSPREGLDKNMHKALQVTEHDGDWTEVELDGTGDPAAGMVGGSYGGGIQLVTGAIDCRVDALVPVIAWNSLGTSLYKAETFKQGWASILSGVSPASFAIRRARSAAAARGRPIGRSSQ